MLGGLVGMAGNAAGAAVANWLLGGKGVNDQVKRANTIMHTGYAEAMRGVGNTMNQGLETILSLQQPYSMQSYAAMDQLADLLGIARPKEGYAVAARKLQQAGIKASNDFTNQNARVIEDGKSKVATPTLQQVDYDSLGIEMTDPSQTQGGALAALEATPGYQFALNQGMKATERMAAKQGLLGSGNMGAALSKYNQGLAQQTYQNQIANLQNTMNVNNQAAQGYLSTLAPIYAQQAQGVGNARMGLIKADLINESAKRPLLKNVAQAF